MQVAKRGNSQSVRIPEDVVRTLDLKEDDDIDLVRIGTERWPSLPIGSGARRRRRRCVASANRCPPTSSLTARRRTRASERVLRQ